MKSLEQKKAAIIAKMQTADGPKYITRLSDFDKKLQKHAIGLITAFGVFEYDEQEQKILESKNANLIRNELTKQYQIIPLWLSFATGIECLAKSVLIKHDVYEVTNRPKINKHSQLSHKADNYESAMLLYSDFIEITYIDYMSDDLSPFETRCLKKDILHLHDLDIGTVGDVIKTIKRLREKGIVDENQAGCIVNTLHVLSDVRRNVNAHSVHNLTVSGAIKEDLYNLYLPTINLLLSL